MLIIFTKNIYTKSCFFLHKKKQTAADHFFAQIPRHVLASTYPKGLFAGYFSSPHAFISSISIHVSPLCLCCYFYKQERLQQIAFGILKLTTISISFPLLLASVMGSHYSHRFQYDLTQFQAPKKEKTCICAGYFIRGPVHF